MERHNWMTEECATGMGACRQNQIQADQSIDGEMNTEQIKYEEWEEQVDGIDRG
jgi:hypothetical protein